MSKKNQYFSNTFLKITTPIFCILSMVLVISLSGYWKIVIKPYLKKEAQRNANMNASSQSNLLVDALILDQKKGYPYNTIKVIETILLLKERKTNITLINAVQLQMDYEIFNVEKNEFDIKKGQINKDSFITKIPLNNKSNELMGIAVLYSTGEFFKHLKKEMKFKLTIVGLFNLGVLLTAWFILVNILKKIKNKEKEIKQQQAHLIHSGRLTAMGEMATGMAHELNQPLTIIRIKADGLKRTIIKTKIESDFEYVTTIISQVERAAKIIRDMRSFASARVEVELIDLSAPFKAALSFFKEQFRMHQIDFNISIAEDIPKVKVNSQKFEQIIVNLLLNARYAVEKKVKAEDKDYQKQISVYLFYDKLNKATVLKVSDNGIGMDIEEKKRCMDPFYTTKGPDEGMGLGLYIVFSILKEFNMKYEIESIKGQGTNFNILIPLERK